MSTLFDPEAEKSILAAILAGEATQISPVLCAQDFTEAHSAIFRTAQELVSAGQEANLITITTRLRENGQLDRLGGPGYLTSVSSSSFFPSILKCSCERVADLSRQRQILDFLGTVNQMREAGDVEGAVQILKTQLPIIVGMRGSGCLEPSLLTDEALNALDIPQRPSLMGDWFKDGDYGVIFGRRGLGKSWLALGLARALAEGRPFGPWECPKACRVLYVDGEMSLDDYRERGRALSERSSEGNFKTLSHQEVFNRAQKALCLSDIGQQDELTRLCEQQGIDVLFLDNGACLFSGVAENDADDFRDKIEGWLLNLRRRGVAVVLVLHAGRNNAIRGTSKREDAAFWILRLDEANEGERDNGARFITRFVKNRNAPQDPPPLDWSFAPDGGKTRITYREADSMELMRQWISDGLNTCGELAEEMGISKGTVSKMAKKAERAGWLTITGRKYALNER
jgi:hypothetical protein